MTSPTARSLLVLVLMGCSPAALAVASADLPRRGAHGTPPIAADLPSPPSPGWRVHVQELPAEDAWQVRYTLPAPVESVEFKSRLDQGRARGWTVVAPAAGVEWTKRHGVDALFAIDGKPFSSLVVRFDTDGTVQSGGYELNARFTDGGRVLFLGHVALRLPGTPRPNRSDPTVEWRLATKASRHVVVSGRRAVGELMWQAPAGRLDGWEYAYFGPQAPTKLDSFDAIFDPGMPDWMRRSSASFIPKLLELFGTRTRTSLPYRPLFLASHEDSGTAGQNANGGVAGRGLRLATSGRRWNSDTRDSRQRWFDFVAHEVFHLWNGERHSRRLGAEGDSWLSEGSSGELPRAVAPLERLLRLGIGPRAGQWLHRHLELADVRVQLVDYAGALIPKSEIARLAGEQLSMCDCEGRVSFTIRKDHYQFHGEPECRVFSKEHHVTHVGGHSLFGAPHQALETLLRTARAGRAVQLGTTGGKSVQLACRTGATEGIPDRLLALSP